MLRPVSVLLALAGPLIAQEIPIATPTATGSSELNTSPLVACSSAECLASADGTLFRFRSSEEGSATITAPVASMTINGSGSLLVVVRNDPTQLFAREVPPSGPRRRAVR